MTLEGTVVNGTIVLDGAPPLHEGARVRVELTGADDLEDWENAPPPPTTETHEEFLASLRESIANVNDGQGMEARQFLKELAIKMKLPLQPGE